MQPDNNISERKNEKNKYMNVVEIKGFSRTLKIIFCYILPALLVTAVIIAGVWGSKQKSLAEGYRNTAENMYRQAYTELTDSVYNVQISLSKLLVSEAPSTLAYTLDDIWRESGVCVGLMGQIPQSHIDNYEMNQFLVRLGDYARSLSLSVMKGNPISAEDREQLASLYDASIDLHNELQAKLDAGDLPVNGITTEEFFASSNSDAADNNENAGNDSEDASNSNGDEDSRYPTLIYDGPFSESTEKQEARGVTGERADESTAINRAFEILGNDAGELSLDSVSDGKIQTYDFSGTLADGRRVDIAITVTGCHLLWMRADAKGDVSGMPKQDEADALVQAGEGWLESRGYSGMEPTYAQYYDGVAVISYAATQNDVIIYNDLVKLWIDRTDRTVCGVDARNYLFSHIERDIPTEVLPIKDVQGMLSPIFNVTETNLALVPATAQTEVLCYEFKGNLNDDEYVIYLDASTGDEVQIFRIINDENGQLAI